VTVARTRRGIVREALKLLVDLRRLVDSARLDEQARKVCGLVVEQPGRRGYEPFALPDGIVGLLSRRPPVGRRRAVTCSLRPLVDRGLAERARKLRA
jgi:hypothetical protein